MKILLYNQGTSYNHGCEAIIRTISGIISKRYPDASFTVSSFRPDEDLEYIDTENGRYTFINSDSFNKLTFEKRRLIVGSASTVLHNIPLFPCFFKDTVKAAKEADAMISVGGDSFSYGKSAELTTISNRLRKYCGRSVLWGCSIDPKYLEGDEFKYKVRGLKDFSLITARESLTFEAFEKLGFKNARLYPDPAFTLKASEPKEPLFENDRDIVGINISPLIMNYETSRDATLKCYAALVKKILDTTDFNVALVSHVICKTSNDTEASKKLLDAVGAGDRIRIIGDGNAEELKGIISKCRFFVAARTHASIAAYSQRIPTLVVGYSVKSRGIAKDIFGTYEGYVVPVQELDSESALCDAFFGSIVKNEEAIRARYDSVMPDYIARADSAGDEFVSLIERPEGAKW